MGHRLLMYGLDSMLTRNDQPLGFFLNFSIDGNFDFAVDSIFTNIEGNSSGVVSNEFLLLEGDPFDLLDGTIFLLL